MTLFVKNARWLAVETEIYVSEAQSKRQTRDWMLQDKGNPDSFLVC